MTCCDAEHNSPVGMIAKRWIIVRAPGEVPIKKQPVNSDDGLINMLREMISLYPDYQFTVVRLVHGDNIWVDDGAEYLNIHDTCFGDSKPKGGKMKQTTNNLQTSCRSPTTTG